MTAQRPSSSKPLPQIAPFTAPFWEGTRRSELLVQRCTNCRQWQWTPQFACRNCLTETLAWTRTSGLGRLYSYSAVHRPQDRSAWAESEVPYIVAIVQLDEGPRILTRLKDCAPDAARVGMRVKVAFEPASEEITLYPFVPVPEERGA